jgi:hypothetical protein
VLKVYFLTHNLAEKDNILAPNEIQPPWYVKVPITREDALNGILQDQISCREEEKVPVRFALI